MNYAKGSMKEKQLTYRNYLKTKRLQAIIFDVFRPPVIKTNEKTSSNSKYHKPKFNLKK